MESTPKKEELPDLDLSSDWKIYTLEDLDSERAFEALSVFPAGGMMLQPIARSNNNEVGSKNVWLQVGWEKEETSSEVFKNYVETGLRFQAWALEYVSFGH